MVLCSAATVNRVQVMVPSRGGSSFVELSLGLKLCRGLFIQYGCGQCLALGYLEGPKHDGSLPSPFPYSSSSVLRFYCLSQSWMRLFH